MSKRNVSILLVLAMALTWLPTAALADEPLPEDMDQRASSSPGAIEVVLASAGTDGSVPLAEGPDAPGEKNITLRAIVRDAGGGELTGVPVSWTCIPSGNAPGVTWVPNSADNTATITLTSDYAKDKGAGTYTHTVKAACPGVAAGEFTLEIQRSAPEAAFVGEIAGDSYIQPYGTKTYTATVYDQYGQELPDVQPTWRTSNTSLATVNQSGSVSVETAEAGGSFTLYAYAGESGQARKVIDIGYRPRCKILGVDPSYGSNAVAMTWGDTITPKLVVEPADARITYQESENYGVVSPVSSGTQLKGIGIGITSVIATARAAGYDEGTFEFRVDVGSRPITDGMVSDIPDTVYSGEAYYPEVMVEDNGRTLIEGTHYTVSHTVTYIGEGSVAVIGKSPYSGTVTKKFTVHKAKMTVPPEMVAAAYTVSADRFSSQEELERYCLPQTERLPGIGDKEVAVQFTWKMISGTYDPKGGEYVYEGEVTPYGDFYEYVGPKLTRTITVTPVQAEFSLSPAAASANIHDVKGHLNALTQVKGMPSELRVSYEDGLAAPQKISITGWTEKTQGSIAAALESLEGDPSKLSESVVLRPVYNSGDIPGWATVGDVPEFTLTISNKKIPTFTFSETFYAKVYDGVMFVLPNIKVTGENGEDLGGSGSIAYTSEATGETKPGTPADAGSYKVTATFENDEYYGKESVGMIILPKPLKLTWSGPSDLTYDGTPKELTATLDPSGLVRNDVCTVTVKNGRQTNAGTYIAKAELSNPNYTASGGECTYTIKKAYRTLTATPAAILLKPGGLEGTIPITANGDDGARAKLTAGGDVSAVTLNQATGVITAVGNGVVTVTVSLDETANYQAATPVRVSVQAYANPVLSVHGAGSSADSGAQLSAGFDGGTIQVSGILAVGASVDSIAAALAGGLQGTYNPAEKTYTVATAGGEQVCVYPVDTSGVVHTEVKPVEGKTTAALSSGIPAYAQKEVADAVNDTANNRLENVIPSVAGSLIPEVERQLEGKQTAGREVAVEVSLKVEARGIQTADTAEKKSYTVDVTPQYSIALKEAGTGTVTETVLEKTDLPNEWITTPVTVSVKLPDNLAAALSGSGSKLYAKHTKSGGEVEYLETTVQNAGGGKAASWQMSSFSEVELYTTVQKTVTVLFNDTVTMTKTYSEIHRGENLPSNSTAQPWLIGGKEYTTVAQLLDDDAVSGTVTAVPKARPATCLQVTASHEAGGLRLAVTAENWEYTVLHGTLCAALYGEKGNMLAMQACAVSTQPGKTAAASFLLDGGRYPDAGQWKVFWLNNAQRRPLAPAQEGLYSRRG